MASRMVWASGIARGANLGKLAPEAAAAIRASLPTGMVDLCLAFVSPHFRDHYDRLASLIQEHLPTRAFAGCSADGVMGAGQEFERVPALALVAARLPDVRVNVLHSSTLDLPDADASPHTWRSWLGDPDPHQKAIVVLADPIEAQIEPLLTGLDYAYPNAVKVGGLVSGGRKSGDFALFDGPRVHPAGALMVLLGGAIEADAVVAQGCRPIGGPLAITRCEQNLLLEVDGQPPLQYLAELVEHASEADRALMRSALLVGLQPDDPESHASGDYLIRTLTGIDYARGVLSVGAPLREGQLLCFYMRDQATAVSELDLQLERCRGRNRAPPPAGALVFSCVGRGQSFYGAPNLESELMGIRFPNLSLGGCFCNGEIGPINGVSQIHGYTSVFAFFRPDRRGLADETRSE